MLNNEVVQDDMKTLYEINPTKFMSMSNENLHPRHVWSDVNEILQKKKSFEKNSHAETFKPIMKENLLQRLNLVIRSWYLSAISMKLFGSEDDGYVPTNVPIYSERMM
jgi:hypothetical protein